MTIVASEKLPCSSTTYLSNPPVTNRSSILIRLAFTSEELTKIYQFRYRISVDQMAFPQFYADHTKRIIKDPFDGGAYNFAAFQQEQVVGVLRFNFSRTSNISYYENFLNMKSVGRDHPNATSISTRLMVVPRLRGTSLALRLCQAGYEFGLRHEIRYNFVDCNDHLTGFFERLGYRFQGRAEHPEYGIGTVMRLDLLDRLHLAKMRSPFLAVLNRANALGESAPGIA
jgi:hypothetical protein